MANISSKKIEYLDLLARWQEQDLGGKRPGKSACVVRYGGIGDYIQASSILPGLKQQGYHVTLNVESSGYELLKFNPYIDAFFIQEFNQVPNPELGPYWGKLAACFDRFINLSESVESSLLAAKGKIHVYWPKEARHAYMNHNYLDMTHLIAGVPFPPYHVKFYPSNRERKWATREYHSIGGRVILWTLSGSSVNKAWPWLDNAVARIMLTYPDVKIVFVGDTLSQILEMGWEKEPRIIRRSGIWSVRQTLTFAEMADLVIGPETGVLNAVSFLPVPKIITLSHSSIENLTRDWVNCISLEPEGCDCYPCHILHYGFDFCKRDEETGVADCQAKISLEKMFEAIRTQLENNISSKKAI